MTVQLSRNKGKLLRSCQTSNGSQGQRALAGLHATLVDNISQDSHFALDGAKVAGHIFQTYHLILH